MSFQEKIIFIVGNSRSGTTMMLRALNKHPNIIVLNELHFFEQLWSSADKGKIISKDDAIILASKLLLTQRKGYMTHDQDFTQFTNEATQLVNEMNADEICAEDVFNFFTIREAQLNNKTIICEKTPQNVFYLKEIFDLYPNAKVINMVRDPRAIMLSQKNKWNRRKLGSDYMTKKEAFRLRINYHPITLSKLWNAAINAAKKFQADDRMLSLRFEDLLNNPANSLQKICSHINVDFDNNMLNITQESSSVEQDSTEIGFKKERANNWKKGGLNTTERWFCERICSENISLYHYEKENLQPNLFYLMYYIISFPVKLFFAFLLNLNRMKNVLETLKRRLR